MTITPPQESPPLRLAWLIWGIGASFYLMAFFQRVAPAVMTDALMREFDIGAAALGNLSALYFYSYVAMQIPTGIIADRWGPRRLLSLGALVAGIGALLFALAPGMLLVGAGRLLIGGSVAVAFVGLLQLANNWFPPRYYAMAAGMALFVGIIGAVCAGPPLRLLVDHFGWRATILFSSLATFVIAAAIWTQVRDHPHEKGFANGRAANRHPSSAERLSVMAGLRKVLQYRNTLLLFFIPGGIVGPVLTFSGLWGVPFLTTHHGLIAALVAVLIIAGFCSGCMIIGFAYGKESVPASLSGTATGMINMGVMSGPMLLQPLVGWMLDLHWNGRLEDGVRIYGFEAYEAGFGLMIVWTALALVLLCFTRDTRCRPMP